MTGDNVPKKDDLADTVPTSQVHSTVRVLLSAGLPGSLQSKSAWCQTEEEADDRDDLDDECVRAKSVTGWRVMFGSKMRGRSVFQLKHPFQNHREKKM